MSESVTVEELLLRNRIAIAKALIDRSRKPGAEATRRLAARRFNQRNRVANVQRVRPRVQRSDIERRRPRRAKRRRLQPKVRRPPRPTPPVGGKVKTKTLRKEFDESKHKRDDVGRFARKQGGKGKKGKKGGGSDAGAIHVKINTSAVDSKYGKVVHFEDGSWGYKNPSKDMIGPNGLIQLNADQKKTLDNIVLGKIQEWRTRMLPSERRDWDNFAAAWKKLPPKKQERLANRAERSRR